MIQLENGLYSLLRIIHSLKEILIYTRIYNIYRITQELTPMDPAWVGAWWMGFVVTAIGFLLVTFPLFGYPTNLPGLHPKYLLHCPIYFRMPNCKHFNDFIYML